MDYSRFTVEDFVLDRKFRKWILSPDTETNMFWDAWLEKHPHKLKTLQEAKTIVIQLPKVDYGWNDEKEDTLWQSIYQDIHHHTGKKDTKVISLHASATLQNHAFQQENRKWHYHQIGKVAAAILLLLCAGLAYYFGIRSIQKASEEHPVTYINRETPLGKKEKFHLPDGTFVVLNAGSAVKYPVYFSDTLRLIEVTGEAFLEVAKDTLRPFKVKTGDLVTQALGTAFNVRNFGESVEIALVEGKVKVSRIVNNTTEANLTLLPGEKAVLNAHKNLVKAQFDPEKVTAWKEGVLLLESASEREIIHALEQWYGVNISVQGHALRPWQYSGTFDNKSLEYVLKSMGYTMGFTFWIEDTEVTIRYQ